MGRRDFHAGEDITTSGGCRTVKQQSRPTRWRVFYFHEDHWEFGAELKAADKEDAIARYEFISMTHRTVYKVVPAPKVTKR